MMMCGFGYGAAGWVWMLLLGVVVVVPFWRLLPRHGVPAWVAVLSLFPLFALILLWVMAFRDPVPKEAT